MRDFLEKGRNSMGKFAVLFFPFFLATDASSCSAVRPTTSAPLDSIENRSIRSSSPPTSSPRKRRLSATDLEEEATAQAVNEEHSSSSEVESQPIVVVQTIKEPTQESVVDIVQRPSKRLRLGFSIKTFAVGVVTGAVAAVGGLSALGAYLEE
jgi:cytoskeletal protein RodZ